MAFYLYMCAQKLIKLKAIVHSDIEHEVKQIFEDHGIGGKDRELHQFLILQDITGISYSAWYDERVDELHERQHQAELKKKRQELERLKRKLERLKRELGEG